jgi:hypothetical protein
MVSKADNSRESIIHPKQRGGGQVQGVNSADDVIFCSFVTDDMRIKKPSVEYITWSQFLPPPDFIQY